MVLFSVLQHKILISIYKHPHHYGLFFFFLSDSDVSRVTSLKCLGLGIRTSYLASLVHCLGLFLLSKLSPPQNGVTHAHAYYVKMSTSLYLYFCFQHCQGAMGN